MEVTRRVIMTAKTSTLRGPGVQAPGPGVGPPGRVGLVAIARIQSTGVIVDWALVGVPVREDAVVSEEALITCEK
eukprot:2473813-Heterocapsa_arctica.AAC.1